MQSMGRYAENKKARFDYSVEETYTAGIELEGFEVKSIRAGGMNLSGARVLVRGGEAFLVGASIRPYQQNNTPETYDPERPRRLLLNKKELSELENMGEKKGLTIVPLSVYNKGRMIKCDIAVARGKKKFDKREATKEREVMRDIRRTVKRG